jgi:mono/diheme cytochrome c family protein
MRRLALLSVGVLGFAACQAATSPQPTEPAATPAPSVLATPGAAETPPTTTSAEPQPAIVIPSATPTTTTTPTFMRARPISGGTLRVLADGHTAVASDADRDQIYVVDLVAGKVTSTIALAAGDEPGRVVEDSAGLAHVALRGGGAVATIDPKAVGPASGTLVARRELCAAPRGLAYDSATNELHVACAGGELVSIAATPTATMPLRTLHLERDLRDVVVSTNGRLMVSTFRSAAVYTVNGDGSFATPKAPTTDVFGRNPGVAWRMVGGPNGSAMMLHELATQQPLGTFPGAYGGQTCGGIVTSTVTVIAPDGEAGMQPGSALASAVVGADVAISPNGAQMAVVSIATGDQANQVQFFAVNGNVSFSPKQCWPADPGPTAPPADDGAGTDGLPPPTDYLPPNGQVVAVAYDARGNVVVQSREPASLQILTQRGNSIVLSQESRFDLGQQLFHSATGDQIACVSCHPEGGEDGRVWQFQTLGARRTQSLRGGIMDTAPFHWGGDEPNMSSLMTDVFQGRMAGGTVDDARVAALGRWLDQIPTIPVSHWSDDATVARGAALFTSSGCVSCHAGADFTNGQTVDVGTGGAFQVPQLHGLGLRAPYMHNGCAATLRDRFSAGCGGDAKHFADGTFTDAQITDLVGYLETL